MRMALAEAGKAVAYGEIPVGAVLVIAGEVIAVAHNMRETGRILQHTQKPLRSGRRLRGLAGGGYRTQLST